ncbi:MAG TPA: DUF308 domain-containing protein [Caulobacteraceae bacterium]|nr:DUF308 domain-containing protein [Caulobacteraceae bacterium]
MTATHYPAGSDVRHRVAPWFIAEGVLLIVLGVVAAALPGIAGVAAAVVFGWVLILAGLFGLTSLIGSRDHAHLLWSIVSGLVALVVGALIVWAPLVGAVTLTLFIAVYMLLDGLALAGIAWDQRKRGATRWGWLMVAAALDVLLAVLIVALGPLSDAVLLGFVIAIDLIVAGIALAAMGLAARKAAV